MIIRISHHGLLPILVCGLFLTACKNEYHAPPFDSGEWRKAAAFEGMPRGGAVCFTMGQKAFVGLGFDGKNYYNDWYAYDAVTQYWQPIDSFPGPLREQAVAFSLNGKGYVGTGFNRDSNDYLKDFWQYDPALDQWKRLKDFPGGARMDAVAFSDGTYGYLGTGLDSTYKCRNDFWQYDPSIDNWKLIPSYGGIPRKAAMTCTINDKTYLFGGQNNGVLIFDMWVFDAIALAGNKNPWTDLTPVEAGTQYNNFKSAVGKSDAVAFSLNNKVYITTGSNHQILTTTWQYDPSNQTYRVMTDFGRAPRTQAVAFVIGDQPLTLRAFVATGVQGSTYYDDMMEFRFIPQIQ